MKKTVLTITAALALAILAGCSSTPDDKNKDGGGPPGGVGIDGAGGLGRTGGSGGGLGGAGGMGGMDADVAANEAHRVYFGYDSAAIDDTARGVLMRNAQEIRAQGGRNVTVEGHCDERGTREYNLALGQKRADAVRDFLVSQGVDARRIQTISFGKEKPLVVGHDDFTWNKNRRGEILMR